MSEFKPGQTYQPPAAGLRPGGRLGGIDPSALAKAEAALKSLSANFGQWMATELDKLDLAWSDIRAHGPTAETMEALYLRAHDLKGLGTTYGFPIVTQIAARLCRLLDDKVTRVSVALTPIEAHVLAIKTAVADNITEGDSPAGRRLLQSLEPARSSS